MELLTLFLVHWLFIYADGTQILPEDADQYTVYCPPSLSQVQVYLVRTHNVESRIFTCTNISIPCNGALGSFTAVFNNTGSYFPFYYGDIVYMRSIIGIKCFFVEKNNNYTEDILTVSKPQYSSCDAPALLNDYRNISITCRTSKVYPQANCILYMQNTILGTITYSHVNDSQVIKYYNTTCTWTSSLSNFGVGQYQYNVSFFPSGTSMNYGSSLTQSIQFTLSKPRLSDECFHGPSIVNGYIKPGSIVYCICYAESNGFPPAIIRWLDSDGKDVGTNLNSSATSISVSDSMQGTTNECLHSSFLRNGNVSLNYTVQYAIGPKTCTVEPQNTVQTIWNICNNERIVNVSIICSIYKSDVKPGMKSIIFVNTFSSGVLDSEVNNASDNMYRTSYGALLTQAGDYSIGCQVQNNIFTDLKTTCTYSKDLQVYAPPDSSPILKITNKNRPNVEENIQENEVYVVECSVLGGVPLVSNVTVSCGNITESTQSGNIFTSPVTFTRIMTGQNCTCTAKHITGCYIKNMFQQLKNIFYVPAVKVFYTDSATVVDNGTRTLFVCKADGNPLPQIYISKGSLVIYENLGQNVSFYKYMYCGDSGIYTCQAKNSIGASYISNRQNVTLFVKCPLYFDVSEDYTEFSFKAGQQFVKTFKIFGYPEPSNFSVIKVGNRSNNVIVNYTSTEADFSTLDIKILHLVEFDFGYYTLSIFQNGFPNLIYSFAIVKVTEKDADNVGAAVGGSIAAFVIIVSIVVGVVYIVRKKSIIKKRAKRLPNPTYSELSVSQSLQERHNYETPIMNSDLKLIDDKQDTSNRYVNVTVASENLLNANISSYCNTDAVNQEFFHETTNEQKDNENEESPYEKID